MPQMIEMDKNVTLRDQLQHEVGPVILINTFTVQADEADQLLRAWAADAAYFKQQPGFISTQLHRGIGGSSVFVNYAVWESMEQFQAFGSTLMPIMRKLGVDPGEPQVMNVHNVRNG